MNQSLPTRPFFLLLFLFSQFLAEGQQSIRQYIDEWVKDPELKHAGISISVKKLGQAGNLAEYQPDLSLIPASTLKVLTTASGLAILGKNYRFSTEIQYDGSIDASGQLNGNLYIKGYGDPTLGSDQMTGIPDLDEVMELFRLSLQQKGIRRINGNVYGDGTYYPSAVSGASWPWYDLGNYYAAGIYGLNLHENYYYLDFQQVGELGKTPPIRGIRPFVPGLSFVNEIRTAVSGRGDEAYIYGAPYTFERFVRGTIGRGSGTITIKGAIPDPPLFAAQYFIEKLKAIGIQVSGTAASLHQHKPDADLGYRQKTYTYSSPPLLQIVERANQKSINLYCEGILRQIGMKTSKEGSTLAGIEALQQYWEQRSLDFSGIFLEDGSGLSPRNAVSSRFLTDLLELIAGDAQLYEDFKNTLPVVGKNGTLSYMLRNTSAQGRIFAKSGSMERVRCYTGYALDREDQLLVFTILVNNYTCTSTAMRQKIEKFLLFLVESKK